MYLKVLPKTLLMPYHSIYAPGRIHNPKEYLYFLLLLLLQSSLVNPIPKKGLLD